MIRFAPSSSLVLRHRAEAGPARLKAAAWEGDRQSCTVRRIGRLTALAALSGVTILVATACGSDQSSVQQAPPPPPPPAVIQPPSQPKPSRHPPRPKPPPPPPARPSRPQQVQPASSRGEVCWPALKIPAVHIPAVHVPATHIPATHIPATHIPAVTVGGVRYPAQDYPAQDYPAQDYPAQDYPAQTIPGTTIPGSCFDADSYLAPSQTNVRTSNYGALDPQFSSSLSTSYWRGAGSVPDYTAHGFGELNEAGFPKNQYVRSYVRRDGTFVHGYWRNSPSDGLPTCRIINC
jgi:hypothetical protein